MSAPFMRRLRRTCTVLWLVLALLPTTEAVAAYRAATAGCIHGAMSACCCTKGCARTAKPAEGMQCHRKSSSDSDQGVCFRSCSRDSGDSTFTPHVLRFRPSDEALLPVAVDATRLRVHVGMVRRRPLATPPPAPPPRSL